MPIYGYMDLSFGCLDLYFGCLDLYFGCLDLYFGCQPTTPWSLCLPQALPWIFGTCLLWMFSFLSDVRVPW